MTSRADAKDATRRRLLEAAGEVIREQGAPALSLREVARRAGIVPSAVYRHLASRDELITQLVLAAYTSLAEHLETTVAASSPSWRTAADALREWTLAHVHEFQLIYGTPVPGYRAPEETITAAARVAAVFLQVGAVSGAPPDALAEQLREPAAQLGTDVTTLARTLADLSQLVGLLTLELGGHFVGTADPAQGLWDEAVARQAAERAPSR